ncbi:SH3 domain-containing protein [Candidatus Dojkabacteria bacterium]|nr:SH3 domain-containing protein [Candidatus Dojkabacteria bacterium]
MNRQFLKSMVKKVSILFHTLSFFIVVTFINYSYAQDINSLPQDFRCKCELSDVTENTELCYYVNFLYYNYFISGYSDGTYRANNQVTRGEFAKYVSNAFGLTLSETELEDLEKFPDVSESHVFYKYIYSLKKAGIIHGYTDGEYKPEEKVSRGQTAKFISNSLEKILERKLAEDTEEFFSDITEENVFATFIKKLYRTSKDLSVFDQVINTNSDLYRPEDFLTRGELAKIIVNSSLYAGTNRNSNFPSLSIISAKIQSSDDKYKDGVYLNHFHDLGLTMLKTYGDIYFKYNRENLLTLHEIAEQNNFVFAANASYFGAFKRERPLGDVLDRSKSYVIIEGTHSYLRIRSTPTTETEDNIIGKLYDFEIVEKLNENEEWYEILDIDDNIQGWISKAFSRDLDLDNDKQYYWEYLHAGLLNYYGQHLFPVKQLHEDSQVTHIVRYDTATNEMMVYDVEGFEPMREGYDRYLEFQTGPLMSRDGDIELDWVNNSANGKHKRKRNILVIGENRRTKYLILAIEKAYSLNELTHIILNMEEFRNSYPTIIALDGGNSVQLYSKDYEEYNFLEENRRPNVIGFK